MCNNIGCFCLCLDGIIILIIAHYSIMKVKEILQTGNIAWSPSSHYPIYLATGTVTQQLDATFSTSAKLEILSVDLSPPGMDMKCVGSVESDYR